MPVSAVTVPCSKNRVKSTNSELAYFELGYGNEDRYERLGADAYEAVIEPELADFVSQAFENRCQDILPDLYPAKTFSDIGRW